MVVQVNQIQGGGSELVLRLTAISPSWYYRIVPVRDGLKATLLDGSRRPKLEAIVYGDEKKARDVLDCYMRDVQLPRQIRIITKEDRRPANTCMYCQDGISKGMPYCRKSACMVKAQINLQTRGRL